MPRPPKIKIRASHGWPTSPAIDENLFHELPEEVKREIGESKDPYKQFRMPIDVWGKLRTRQIEMEKDAKEIMKLHDIPFNEKSFTIPMTEIMRKTLENPLFVKDQDDLLKMMHKKGKGRMFL